MKTKQLSALLVMTTLIVSCSDARNYLEEKYTGERRGEMVGGGRRPPLLNPNSAPQFKPMEPPAVAMERPAITPTPYDQYDEHGNDVSRTNYLEKLFSEDATPPATMRKSFKQRKKTLKKRSVDAPPLEAMPESLPESPVVISSPLRRPLPMVTPITQETVVPPLPPATPPKRIEYDDYPLTEEENGVMVPLPEEHSELDLQNDYEVQMVLVSDEISQTPISLSSVPKKPAIFEDIQAQKIADQEALEMDHNKAMEDKKALAEEPSEWGHVGISSNP